MTKVTKAQAEKVLAAVETGCKLGQILDSNGNTVGLYSLEGGG